MSLSLSFSLSPVARAVSTGDWAICLAFVTKWCQATTNCQTFVRVCTTQEGGEGETRQQKRSEEKRATLLAVLTAIFTKIARKIADRFSIVLDILIMLGRSICTHRVRVDSRPESRDQRAETGEQRAETAVATFLAVAAAVQVDAACLIPLRRVAALFPLNAQTFHSLTA